MKRIRVWTVLAWTAATTAVFGVLLSTALAFVKPSAASFGFLALGWFIFGSIGLLGGALGGITAAVVSRATGRWLSASVGGAVAGIASFLGYSALASVAPAAFAVGTGVVAFATLLVVTRQPHRAA
jgi:hypothetical protein